MEPGVVAPTSVPGRQVGRPQVQRQPWRILSRGLQRRPHVKWGGAGSEVKVLIVHVEDWSSDPQHQHECHEDVEAHP